MSFLKELTDKGATIAWSNVAAHPGLIALGTKVRPTEETNVHYVRDSRLPDETMIRDN